MKNSLIPRDLPPAGIDLKKALAAAEERFVRQAIERAAGNRSHAAHLLGLTPGTMSSKLKSLGFRPAKMGRPKK